MPDFSSAISGIESGGNYGLLGPTTKTGDRAYGKYQVMGENVGPWSKEILGVSLTPQQFLQNPQAQDAVFQAKFGQYAQKYGPEGAARAWFAGERGMNNPSAKDQLGTSVADYARRFNTAMGAPISGPQNPASQQPTIPIQTAQGAPQAPTQQLGTAPNSGMIGASPYSNQALTGGGGLPIGGLPTQSPMQNLSGPTRPQINPIHLQNFQKLLASMPQQIRPYIFGMNS